MFFIPLPLKYAGAEYGILGTSTCDTLEAMFEVLSANDQGAI